MPATDLPAADSGDSPGNENLVFFNGIDAETGQYAVKPKTVDDLAKLARANPQVDPMRALRGETEMRSFGLPPGVDYEKLDQAGWGVIFHENAPDDVKDALKPLIDKRRRNAGALFKTLDYKTGEQVRDWYRRHGIRPGSVDPEVDPVLPPDRRAAGRDPVRVPVSARRRLCGRTRVVRRARCVRPLRRSVAAYETASAIQNAKQIAYWGTRHPADPATNLSRRSSSIRWRTAIRTSPGPSRSRSTWRSVTGASCSRTTRPRTSSWRR